MPRIDIARVYDHPPGGAGRRFLVDRLWPRGIRRDEPGWDAWLPDAAPSRELRAWFGHRAERWPEFRRRYTAELDRHPETWRELLAATRDGPVTLLYGARDTERNNAVVLRDYLLARLAEAPR